MVTKLKKISPTSKTTAKSATAAAPSASKLSDSVKESAQQIWQAGLGAFNKAQTEGSKAFEALVKEGVSFQRKTQSAAEEKISEATQKMTSMATDISSKASGQWDKLETIFEDRVAKALNKLGVPSAKDISALIARIDALNASVQKLAPSKTKVPTKEEVKPAEAKTAPVHHAIKRIAKKAAKTTKLDTQPVAKPIVKRAAPRKTAVKPVAPALAIDAKVNPN